MIFPNQSDFAPYLPFSIADFSFYIFIYNSIFLSVLPIKLYVNADTQKLDILKENRKLSGVYMWQNKENDQKYIGSSETLSRRFLQYFNTKYLLKNTNMIICKALLKYGYSNFSLSILEYCEPDKCLEREQYYIDL